MSKNGKHNVILVRGIPFIQQSAGSGFQTNQENASLMHVSWVCVPVNHVICYTWLFL